MNGRDVILTGVPRSGTTLVCTLLNKLPHTVALNEPMNVTWFNEQREPTECLDRIARFYARTRMSLARDGAALSKQAGGVIVDNNYGVSLNERGLRTLQVYTGPTVFGDGMSADTLLCTKHPGLYTALLDRLTERYRCYAVIRNPLAVLASWSSVDIHARNGSSPTAEALCSELGIALGSIDDAFDRQLRLLSWYYGRYRDTLSQSEIIRYEEVIASGGRALSHITAEARCLDEHLENRNESDSYDRMLTRTMGERLLRSEGAYWDFYSRESVEELL